MRSSTHKFFNKACMHLNCPALVTMIFLLRCAFCTGVFFCDLRCLDLIFDGSCNITCPFSPNNFLTILGDGPFCLLVFTVLVILIRSSRQCFRELFNCSEAAFFQVAYPKKFICKHSHGDVAAAGLAILQVCICSFCALGTGSIPVSPGRFSTFYDSISNVFWQA